MSFTAPATMGVRLENPEDVSTGGCVEPVSIWSYISEWLAEEHYVLQDQYQLLMHWWNSVNDLLTYDKTLSDTLLCGLQTKDAKIHRLV